MPIFLIIIIIIIILIIASSGRNKKEIEKYKPFEVISTQGTHSWVIIDNNNRYISYARGWKFLSTTGLLEYAISFNSLAECNEFIEKNKDTTIS